MEITLGARRMGVCLVIVGVLATGSQAQSYIISTAAGGGSPADRVGDGGPATQAIVQPFDVAVDSSGNLFIADAGRVRKVTTNGIITTVAGGGSPADGVGDGGPATQAAVSPVAVAVDASGNLYISDIPIRGPRVRKVNTQGIITTIAGTGISGYSGDGGPATSAQVSDPMGIAVDSAGNVYLADRYNARIRKISTSGIITTVAGGGRPASGIGDGGPAVNATLLGPYGVAVDPAGNLFISDLGNVRIRKVATNGVISTIAGNGTSTYSGDGGPAVQAGIDSPWHVAVDGLGNIFITTRLDTFATSSGNYVRLVNPSGIISTIAGNGNNTLGGGHTGYGGDGGPATQAELHTPEGIAVSSTGLVYVAQLFDFRVRLLTPTGPPQGSQPAITAGGIVPLYSSSNSIQPGSWISIFGTNLASTTATWAGDFPTSLGGTSVMVNNKPAYLWFVSPTQINLQAPDDTFTGTANVTVTNASGNASSAVTLSQFAPSFSLLDSKHVTGIILRTDNSGAYGNGSYDILGPTGTSLGYKTVAAKAGDSVVLFGVGFGPTNPQVPAGKPYSGSAPTTNTVQLQINNMTVLPAFTGLTSAGLYQINLVQIPANLGSGDVPLRATVGGVQTPAGIVISLQ
jgi:uncharacterized protein (TIGR03437 family)